MGVHNSLSLLFQLCGEATQDPISFPSSTHSPASDSQHYNPPVFPGPFCFLVQWRRATPGSVTKSAGVPDGLCCPVCGERKTQVQRMAGDAHVWGLGANTCRISYFLLCTEIVVQMVTHRFFRISKDKTNYPNVKLAQM